MLDAVETLVAEQFGEDDVMRQALHRLSVATRGQGARRDHRAGPRLAGAQAIATGLLTLFCRHTSASLLIQENADPDVRRDLEDFFERLAPEGRGLYVHETEGPDDMPAHIRVGADADAAFNSGRIGRMLLGTWQGIYLFEHRSAPHRREIVLHLIGE